MFAIVDTGPLVAFFDRTEQHHRWVCERIEELETPLLAEIHTSALNRAKADSNVSVDMLARVAVLKFLRVELSAQFAQLLERCRMMLKTYEGLRQQKAILAANVVQF